MKMSTSRYVRSRSLFSLILFSIWISNPGKSSCQEGIEELQPVEVTLEELERRAEEVTFLYPWLVQNYSGLSLNAYNIPREEFLRGIRAATDLVFDGTENLDPQVTLTGRFPNIADTLKAACREDPYLVCEIDFPAGNAVFKRLPDETAGVSDVALISRYRQVKVDPNLIRRNYGVHFAGSLVVNGSLFPPPFDFQVEPLPSEARVGLKINGFPITEFIYTDPMVVDQNLYRAANLNELKTALTAKLDQSWRMTCRFPLASTPEMLSLVSQQAQFLYGVVRSEPMIGGLRLHLNEGEYLDWTLPKATPGLAFDGADAYQKAIQLQNSIVGGLSAGGIVFQSNRFGFHILSDPLTFQENMNRIVAEEGDLRSKEKEIRIVWKDEAEWVLEYFYTSVIPDSWMDAPPKEVELIPNTDSVGPVFENPAETRIREAIEEAFESSPPAVLPSDLVPLEIPSQGRGLMAPSEEDPSADPENSEIIFENSIDGEENVDQPDPQP